MHADTSALPDPEDVDLAVEMFRMLADGTRLRLIWCLQDGEKSVGDLAAAVDKAPTSVSQHLAKLRLARLVQTRREGTSILYRLDSEHVGQLVVDGVHHAEHQHAGVPRHHSEQGVRELPAHRATERR